MQNNPQDLSVQNNNRKWRRENSGAKEQAVSCWVFVIWTRFKVSCGCLIMRRNIYLWITRWKPILLCGGFSQSHQTSIKVLVKCLSDFFIIHLEALRLAPDQKWHGSLLNDLYTYATVIPKRCQDHENVSALWYNVLPLSKHPETSAWDTKFRRGGKSNSLVLMSDCELRTKCRQPWNTQQQKW